MVVAASGGRRIGGPEALLRQGDALLVDSVCGIAREVGCAPLVVVLGASANQVRRAAALEGATVVIDKAWGTGLGSSLRVGLEALKEAPAEIDAALVFTVDMPGVTVEAARRVALLPHSGALVCATYDGMRSYPMLLGRRHWAGIATLAKSDVGARPYLLAHKTEIVDIACDAVADGNHLDNPDALTLYGLSRTGGE
ncbi:NTP transferase domain-containing protein [Asanoa sp. WMMD1127]|uniref:nucleotidyltransferase family protein n=1 Tax=Asanoa sp. WMMD1127 TaxID=3016107 RepID=UPI002415A624|nr:NTP transferase domain-containing protein [Asanoa sp. WMMD1127]MDG4826702.1 NTP transferase domain-containing protein [Asanoa sp. WMMD1127]